MQQSRAVPAPGRRARRIRALAASGSVILTLSLLAVGARAAEVVSTIQEGALGQNEHTCTQITYLFAGADCTYGRNRPSSLGSWLGPLYNGAHYARGSSGDSIFYAPVSGDSKIEAPVTGTVTIDDGGTPGDGSDDSIALQFVIGAMARNLATGQSTRTVQSWDAMTHTVAPTPVNAAAPNAQGGYDYILGSRGFPEPLCSATDPADCFPTDNVTADFSAPLFWAEIDPGSVGIERSGLLADPATTPSVPGTAGNVGAASTAVFDGSYACATNNGVVDDCTASTVVWGAGEPAGFDNIVAKISTDSDGLVVSASLYWTEEYAIGFGAPPPGYDNSAQMGSLRFTGAGDPGPVGNAQDDQFNVARNATGKLLDVLANDTGFADPVTVAVVDGPDHGTAEVTGSPGNQALVRISYTPDPGYSGPDTLTYSVADGASTDTATVTLTVIGPEAVNDAAQTKAGTPVAVAVLANDTGFQDPVTVTVTGGPAHGTAVVTGSPGNASGIRINYTPAGGFSGQDTLTYQVSDGVDSDTATVTITVLAYKANPDTYTFLRNTCCQSLFVVANDVGFKSPATVAITQYPNKGGSVYVNQSPGNPAQIYIYYHPYNYNQPASYTETFSYQIYDGTHVDTATVTVNLVPYAALPDAATSRNGEPVVINVSGNDLGFGYPATVGFFANPQQGTAVVTGYPGNQTVTYTPNPGFRGVDTFEYAIDDGTRIDTALVTVSVIDDADGDAVDDGLDNCLNALNVSQRDSNGDGFGNWCDGDLNNDGRTNFGDLAIFRARFGSTDPDADLDGSGLVNFADLARLQALFGRPPGPSALVP